MRWNLSIQVVRCRRIEFSRAPRGTWSRAVYNYQKYLTLNLKERTLSQAWSLLSMLLTLTVAAAFGRSSPISRKVIFIGVRADCQVVNRCLEGNGCKTPSS